jgi:hypothetical protein
MNHHWCFGAPAPHLHHQGVQHQFCCHGGFHGPAHHCAGVRVNHQRQIQPAFIGADVGDIRDPDLVRLCDCEFPLQKVWRCGGRHAYLVARSLVAAYRTQLSLAHKACNALLDAGNAGLAQVALNAWAAVNALAVFKRLCDVSFERFIGKGTSPLGGGLPSVMPLRLIRKTRHMLLRRHWPWCEAINAYLTRTVWQNTLRPFLGCYATRWPSSNLP